MQPAHTPGPWLIDYIETDSGNPEQCGPCITAIVSDKSAEPICDINDNSPEAAFNARLIAAAPDMLAALEFINRLSFGNPYLRRAGDIARSAIAHATGDAK